MKRTLPFCYIISGLLILTASARVCDSAVRDGAEREYFGNGKLRIETVYKKGQIVRKRIFYHNGRLLREEKYKDGLTVKKAAYYENGNLKSLWTKKSGVTKFYREDGRLHVVVDTDSTRDNDFPSSYLFR